MGKYLGVLLVLLLAPSVWAEDPAGDGCNQNIRNLEGEIIGMTLAKCDRRVPTITAIGSRALRITRESFDAMLAGYPEAKLRVELVDESCLAQMEAAMRAMDKVILSGRLPPTTDKGYKNLAEAIIPWVDAKRTCWRQP